MATKRGRYTTRQQEAVATFFEGRIGESWTVDEVCRELAASDVVVGKTTVYRAMERLVADGIAVTVPDASGGPARYCVLGADDGGTCLVCLECHHVFPLSCDGLDHFVEHVESDHGFTVLPRRTILYGYCDCCSRSALAEAHDSGKDSHHA